MTMFIYECIYAYNMPDIYERINRYSFRVERWEVVGPPIFGKRDTLLQGSRPQYMQMIRRPMTQKEIDKMHKEEEMWKE